MSEVFFNKSLGKAGLIINADRKKLLSLKAAKGQPKGQPNITGNDDDVKSADEFADKAESSSN